MKRRARFLVVGSHAAWATSDVFRGIVDGLYRCGAYVQGYPLFERLTALAEDVCIRELHSMAMDCRWAFDYVVFVTGTSIPPWVPLSIKGPMCIALITEDPQIIDTSRNMARSYDMTISNEKANDYTSHYLGTAAVAEPHVLPYNAARETDLVFIGSLYPERVRFFERIEPWARARELKVRIIGNFADGAPGIESPISDWCECRRIPLAATLAYLKASKVVLNLHRTPFGAANQFKVPGYSTNPRTYEAASVGAFMIADNTRGELMEIFGDTVPVFRTPAEFCDMMDYYLDAQEEREAKARKAKQLFLDGHTYWHRAKALLGMLEAEKKEEEIPEATGEEVESLVDFFKEMGPLAKVIEPD